MSFFYRDDALKVGTEATGFLDVSDLIRSGEGPAYVYDLDNIESRYLRLTSAFTGSRMSVHYAMKANNDPRVLELLASLGAGADTVSAGEIRLALATGFTAEKIIFSGVGKTTSEIEFALRQQIKQINIESPQELVRVCELSKKLGLSIDVAFRMNPDVNPKTHPYITTGFRENKFGMDVSFLPELRQILLGTGNQVRLRGLTMHIGSQLLELNSIEEALQITVSVFKQLQNDPVFGANLDRIDIGGGLGIDYTSQAEDGEFAMIETYGKMVTTYLASSLADFSPSAPQPGLQALSNIEILTEPGRILVARAGLLVGEVQYIKRAPAKTFAVLNTGMHHLLRPALYAAKHRIIPIRLLPNSRSSKEGQTVQGNDEKYDIVGPICESSDVLARDVDLPKLEQGHLLGICDSGAYGFTMASNYNMHELPRQIAVRRGQLVNDKNIHAAR